MAKNWPPFMNAVINACKMHQARLVFFDNVYMYASSAIPHRTENAPLDPPSEKGEIRKQLHEMSMTEVEKGNLTALIARSADFYGPDNKNSVLTISVAQNLMKGKKAQTFGNINRIHTYTYTPDAAKATALLGNTTDAYNQVWHVPTTKEKLTGLQWVQLIADELGVEAKVQSIPAWMMHILGLFIPVMTEFPEMLCQYNQDYIFDSGKFEKHFGIEATAPKDGVRNLIENLKSQSGSH